MKKILIIAILGVLVILGVKVASDRGIIVETLPDKTATTTQEKVVDEKPRPTVGPGIGITPSEVFQGDPVLLTVEGYHSTSTIKSFTYNGRPLTVFMHEGVPAALLGIDLRAAVGTFPLVVTFTDGKQLRSSLTVKERVKPKAAFGIPDKLGGNNTEAEKELVSTLVQEANIINAIPTTMEKLWEGSFGSPLENLVVTDIFGYTRLTGGSTFAHKGTDYRAVIGTPVYAMNRGVVRYTGFLRNYGHTVVIDHGLGLHTVYMHLSEITVPSDKAVEKGEKLGLSGDTGYVLGPHLHVTVRIWDISVDPEKFLKLFN